MNNNDILKESSPEINDILLAIREINENVEIATKNYKSTLKDEQFLNKKQVCNLLHICSRSLQNYRDRGILPFYKIGGKLLYKMSDVQKLLDNNFYQAWE